MYPIGSRMEVSSPPGGESHADRRAARVNISRSFSFMGSSHRGILRFAVISNINSLKIVILSDSEGSLESIS
jgi:hypothetical protein